MLSHHTLLPCTEAQSKCDTVHKGNYGRWISCPGTNLRVTYSTHTQLWRNVCSISDVYVHVSTQTYNMDVYGFRLRVNYLNLSRFILKLVDAASVYLWRTTYISLNVLKINSEQILHKLSHSLIPKVRPNENQLKNASIKRMRLVIVKHWQLPK